jgi:hypothetical protein
MPVLNAGATFVFVNATNDGAATWIYNTILFD